MREIKFRAWDGLRMTTSGIMFGSSNGNLFSAGEMPIMQYTGLKDKNGKEIYEGDVVRKYRHSIESDLYTRVGVVEYKEDRFRCFGDKCQFYLNGQFSDIPESSYEVIGNIYENPELLESNT